MAAARAWDGHSCADWGPFLTTCSLLPVFKLTKTGVKIFSANIFRGYEYPWNQYPQLDLGKASSFSAVQALRYLVATA